MTRRHDSSDSSNAGNEFLDILLQDDAGATQAAFGVGSAENVFVNDLGDLVDTPPDSAALDATYLVLVKIAALQGVPAFVHVDKDTLPRIVRLPIPLVYGLAFFADRVFRLLGRASPISVYRVKSSMARLAFDSAASERDLHWKPRVGTEEGLVRTLARVGSSSNA